MVYISNTRPCTKTKIDTQPDRLHKNIQLSGVVEIFREFFKVLLFNEKKFQGKKETVMHLYLEAKAHYKKSYISTVPVSVQSGSYKYTAFTSRLRSSMPIAVNLPSTVDISVAWESIGRQ